MHNTIRAKKKISDESSIWLVKTNHLSTNLRFFEPQEIATRPFEGEFGGRMK